MFYTCTKNMKFSDFSVSPNDISNQNPLKQFSMISLEARRSLKKHLFVHGLLASQVTRLMDKISCIFIFSSKGKVVGPKDARENQRLNIDLPKPHPQVMSCIWTRKESCTRIFLSLRWGYFIVKYMVVKLIVS